VKKETEIPSNKERDGNTGHKTDAGGRERVDLHTEKSAGGFLGYASAWNNKLGKKTIKKRGSKGRSTRKKTGGIATNIRCAGGGKEVKRGEFALLEH